MATPKRLKHALEPVTSLDLYHELKQENSLTQARDHLANERSFGSAIKLVLSMALVGGYFLIRFPQDQHNTVDKAMGATIFALAFVLIFFILSNYFGAVHQYRDGKLQAVSPVVMMVLVLVLALFSLGLCIAEFFVGPTSHHAF